MLKKATDAPVAMQVPLETYGPLKSRYSRCSWQKPDPPASHSDAPASFVLFHDGLKEAARDKGMLMKSTSEAMWSVIVANVEVYDPNEAEETDADKRRNFAATKG